MLNRRITWIALGGVLVAGPLLAHGCTGSDTVTATGGPATCGNGVVESPEACDDGNAVNNDGCTDQCVSSTCGDGEVQAENGEGCDDGNTANDDACTNDCQPNAEYCGNGEIDAGEECDDGNTVTDDDCTNVCTNPECGDGIVQAGEDCDDGNDEVDDTCPPDCMDDGVGGDPCNGQAIYAGYVNDDANPTNDMGPGIPSVWSYAGELGVQAGDAMCAAIGADHICTYEEVVQAETAGELDTGPNALPDGLEFWVHRVNVSLPRLSDNGATMSVPSYGSRCNDWTYPTNHISDAEFGYYHRSQAPAMHANGAGMSILVGNNLYVAQDDDPAYEPALDGANPNPVGGDHACDAHISNAAGLATPGCAGNCGGATPKAILCCFPACNE